MCRSKQISERWAVIGIRNEVRGQMREGVRGLLESSITLCAVDRRELLISKLDETGSASQYSLPAAK
jgi:hypothetical protein